MKDDVQRAWRTNQKITLDLIDKISAAGMKASLSKRGGRDVARQFAHLHDVRVWQIEKRAKDLAEGLEVFRSKESPTKAQLRRALKASGAAVEQFLVDVLEGKPKRRGMPRGVFSTVGYFISHESHHRGNILLTLKECGHKLDNANAYAIWGEWGKK